MTIFWLAVWTGIGTVVGGCNIDNWARMKMSKKQMIFLYIILGPMAWLIGLIGLVVLSFQLTWKLLS